MTAAVLEAPQGAPADQVQPVPGSARPTPREDEQYVQLRPALGLTLADLLDRVTDGPGAGDDGLSVEDVHVRDIEFKLTGNPGTIKLGRLGEVPATPTGIAAFGALFKVPGKFLERFHGDVGASGPQFILENLQQVYGKSAVSVTYTPGGVVKVGEVGRQVVEKEDIVAAAIHAMGTSSAPVVRLVDTPQEFSFDAHVRFNYGQAVGGDTRVNDITAGGLTFGHSIKQNLAPTVGPFWLRQDCTNGMTHRDPGLKIDARGKTAEDVVADLRFCADRAFKRVGGYIKAFYDLRTEEVDNPERVLLAIAEERKIPDRSSRRLLELAATNALPERVTKFDLINLISNLANDPSLMRNDGGRLILERAAGAEIVAHEARCRQCQHKVVA